MTPPATLLPRRRRWKRWLLPALALALLVPAASDLGVTWLVRDVVKDDPAMLRPAPVGVVLGAAKWVPGSGENVFYRARINAAAELYRRGVVRGLLVSGDNGRRDYDESSAMKEDLVAQGVPAEHVTCDYAGFRTLDSMVRAQAVFGQTDLIVVSQRFHCERAVFIARVHGLTVQGYAAADPPLRWQTKVRVREVLARLAAWGDCYVWGAEPRFYGQPETVGLAAVRD